VSDYVSFISFASAASNIVNAIMEIAKDKEITTVCMGKPHLNMWQIILKTSIFNQLLKGLSENDIDLIILS
jgi:two-component system sensor histidine kinase KdpD